MPAWRRAEATRRYRSLLWEEGDTTLVPPEPLFPVQVRPAP
jgi:hypothetical protein